MNIGNIAGDLAEANGSRIASLSMDCASYRKQVADIATIANFAMEPRTVLHDGPKLEEIVPPAAQSFELETHEDALVQRNDRLVSVAAKALEPKYKLPFSYVGSDGFRQRHLLARDDHLKVARLGPWLSTLDVERTEPIPDIERRTVPNILNNEARIVSPHNRGSDSLVTGHDGIGPISQFSPKSEAGFR